MWNRNVAYNPFSQCYTPLVLGFQLLGQLFPQTHTSITVSLQVTCMTFSSRSTYGYSPDPPMHLPLFPAFFSSSALVTFSLTLFPVSCSCLPQLDGELRESQVLCLPLYSFCLDGV